MNKLVRRHSLNIFFLSDVSEIFFKLSVLLLYFVFMLRYIYIYI